jgi:hypothetical protein
MSKRLRWSSFIAALLLVLGSAFQNCAKDLPNEVTNPSVVAPAADTTIGGFKPKVRIGYAKQTADVSSVGTNWRDIPGAAISFTLDRRMTADIRANGSASTTAGATYASTHCGIRFVIDGTPYGHATWGDKIVGVSYCSTASACHTPWTATREITLEPGQHSVRVQMTGWPGADSACAISSQDYAAARLIVEAF